MNSNKVNAGYDNIVSWLTILDTGYDLCYTYYYNDHSDGI